MEISLNIISLNVNGWRQINKRMTLISYINSLKPDIVFLQETYSSYNIEDKWNSEWKDMKNI